ncbi:winged helix DNA-binding domain-containing protein [Actinotalea ferrariae]|uniref:DNA glycosylase AlkZ-like family protein n=1 Tax=Actinotalea ferrariae TaxID=1386098 RepID=UPI001C8B6420|nr:crosslink repair DNA glycosylase YcaQ family protein [Actinotalea ferrariae]MBX9246550.1 winged helix DNA-binding domain-containing protein [Actinotalea ferrariae]
MITGAAALGWRLARHALDPVADGDAADVVRRVVAVRGWPAETADLAVRVRQAEPRPGGLEHALATGDLIRSCAFRGGSYVFTLEDAASLLAARTATRVWETARYQQQGQFVVDDWERLREAVRDALAAGPTTRAELGAHLAGIPALRHLADAASRGTGSDALLKPLHWWGVLCFGPTRDGQSTFRLLEGDPGWPGPLDVDDAGRRACLRYLEAYGPATTSHLAYWLSDGLSVPRRRLDGWLADLGAAVTTVDVDGAAMLARAADVDELSAAEPSDSVVLLPAFDPWLLGPGTADPRIVGAARRSLVSNGARTVVWRGAVAGTWRRGRGEVAVSWFAEAGSAPVARLEAQVERLAALLGEESRLTLEVV